MMRMVVFSSGNPVNRKADCELPFTISFLMGLPVSTAFSLGKIGFLKVRQILSANLLIILLAKPGAESDSWVTIGIFLMLAARQTGRAT